MCEQLYSQSRLYCTTLLLEAGREVEATNHAGRCQETVPLPFSPSSCHRQSYAMLCMRTRCLSAPQLVGERTGCAMQILDTRSHILGIPGFRRTHSLGSCLIPRIGGPKGRGVVEYRRPVWVDSVGQHRDHALLGHPTPDLIARDEAVCRCRPPSGHGNPTTTVPLRC